MFSRNNRRIAGGGEIEGPSRRIWVYDHLDNSSHVQGKAAGDILQYLYPVKE